MSSDDVNKGRRRFLVATTSVVGGVGIGIAAVPFIKSWMPSARAQAIGVPVEVDLAKLKAGQLLKVQWRGQTIGVLHRTEEMVNGLSKVDADLVDPQSELAEQPKYIHGEPRALKPEFLVINMHCTHLGCVPQIIPEVGPQP
ncbi:MAG TPA: ubiquinol-cytochrome c reductase iron-sulfur subunit, partial [Xanthomonadales bacterium]